MEKLQVGDIVRFKLEAWNVGWVRENYANASYRVGRVTDLMVSLVRLDDVSEHETACAVPMDYLELVPLRSKIDKLEDLGVTKAPGYAYEWVPVDKLKLDGYANAGVFGQGLVGAALPLEELAYQPKERAKSVSFQDPLEKQEGGNHYKSMKLQPVEFIHANGIPFIEGCIIKYAARWRNKGGISDLKKIIHFAELLISLEEKGEHADVEA